MRSSSFIVATIAMLALAWLSTSSTAEAASLSAMRAAVQAEEQERQLTFDDRPTPHLKRARDLSAQAMNLAKEANVELAQLSEQVSDLSCKAKKVQQQALNVVKKTALAKLAELDADKKSC